MSTPSKSKKKTLQRGAVRKQTSQLVGGYMPDPMVAVIDQAVRVLDTDRSKFFRSAVREKLERHGFAA